MSWGVLRSFERRVDRRGAHPAHPRHPGHDEALRGNLVRGDKGLSDHQLPQVIPVHRQRLAPSRAHAHGDIRPRRGVRGRAAPQEPARLHHLRGRDEPVRGAILGNPQRERARAHLPDLRHRGRDCPPADHGARGFREVGYGSSYLLQAVLVVILGGVSHVGGKGNILDVVLGILTSG